MSQQTKRRKKYAPTQNVQRWVELKGITSASDASAMTPEEKSADQERRRAILAGLFAKAEALVPDPPDSPTRKSCRESPADEVIAEKFRRQGFNL